VPAARTLSTLIPKSRFPSTNTDARVEAVAGNPREYNCLVRIKTSITLPAELLVRLDRVGDNRSALLERAAVAFLARLERERLDRRDMAIINRNARRLNRESQDTLAYQKLP